MGRLVAFIACITCAVVIRAPVAAQEFPSRPLTLVVPFAARGSTGLIARMMLPPAPSSQAVSPSGHIGLAMGTLLSGHPLGQAHAYEVPWGSRARMARR